MSGHLPGPYLYQGTEKEKDVVCLGRCLYGPTDATLRCERVKTQPGREKASEYGPGSALVSKAGDLIRGRGLVPKENIGLFVQRVLRSPRQWPKNVKARP